LAPQRGTVETANELIVVAGAPDEVMSDPGGGHDQMALFQHWPPEMPWLPVGHVGAAPTQVLPCCVVPAGQAACDGVEQVVSDSVPVGQVAVAGVTQFAPLAVPPFGQGDAAGVWQFDPERFPVAHW
jgi:hypothetical protein